MEDNRRSLLSREATASALGISLSTLDRRVKAGKIVSPIKRSRKNVRYIKDVLPTKTSA